MSDITGGYGMNINYELYRIFYEVAIQENITKASEVLHISQPAVTKQLKNLENQLGGELFIRTRKGVVLTENGREIFNYIKQAMHCFENAELQFSNLKRIETGTIKIGVSTTLCRIFLMPYLDSFHKKYPNVAIQVYTDPSVILTTMLKEGKIDLLISKCLDIDDADLNFRILGYLHQCFIASATYAELRGKTVPLASLNNYPLLFPKDPSTSRESLMRFCHRENIEMTSKIEIASTTLLEDFVQIGFGVGLVTREYSLDIIDNQAVFEVKTSPEIPSIPFALTTLKNSYHSFAANKFIEMIENDMKKHNNEMLK